MTQPLRSLTSFMSGLIDYAGLFPPARLPLEQAVRAYHQYRKGADRWMLSRFIIPASQLPALSALSASADTDWFDPVVCFSVLGRGGTDPETLLAGIRADLRDITEFRKAHETGVLLDMYEVRLPESLISEVAVRYTLNHAGEALSRAGLRPFYEIPSGVRWRERAAATIIAMGADNREQGRTAGFKLRCGGEEAAAFPLPEQVAWTIAACRDAGIALKATAGLHHPIRHYDDGVHTQMHGFINVFGAGILARIHDLSRQEIQEILEDEASSHFSFTDHTFAWTHLSADVKEISRAREFLVSYGSCSFDEPRDDLRALGWL